jgi:hypothetical protein
MFATSEINVTTNVGIMQKGFSIRRRLITTEEDWEVGWSAIPSLFVNTELSLPDSSPISGMPSLSPPISLSPHPAIFLLKMGNFFGNETLLFYEMCGCKTQNCEDVDAVLRVGSCSLCPHFTFTSSQNEGFLPLPKKRLIESQPAKKLTTGPKNEIISLNISLDGL